MFLSGMSLMYEYSYYRWGHGSGGLRNGSKRVIVGYGSKPVGLSRNIFLLEIFTVL
ncbi:hypothetical protein Hanom_Chr03g00222341 [Helianthus anomalus]